MAAASAFRAIKSNASATAAVAVLPVANPLSHLEIDPLIARSGAEMCGRKAMKDEGKYVVESMSR